MGNFYDAVRRAEAPASEQEAPDDGAADAAPAPILDEPGAIHWEGAIFERVTSIERQFDALEEGLGKRLTEVESRLLHLFDRRLGALEAELHRRVSDLATDVALDADRSRSDQRRLLWAVAVVGLLVLLF